MFLLLIFTAEYPSSDDAYRPTNYGGFVNRGYTDPDSSYIFAQYEAMTDATNGGVLPPYTIKISNHPHEDDVEDCEPTEEEDNYDVVGDGDGDEEEDVFKDCTDDAGIDNNEITHNHRWIPEFQCSIVESEYDETLAFPDSVTIISNMGEKPVLVERKETDDDDEEYDDEKSVQLRQEIPFTSIYGPSVKFNSFQRKVFIPGREIHVRIIENDRSVTTHLLNPNL